MKNVAGEWFQEPSLSARLYILVNDKCNFFKIKYTWREILASKGLIKFAREFPDEFF